MRTRIWGTFATSACSTLRSTDSAPCGDAIEIRDQLSEHLFIRELWMILLDSFSRHLPDEIAHLARDEDFSDSTETAVDGGLSLSCFWRRVQHAWIVSLHAGRVLHRSCPRRARPKTTICSS